MVHATDDRRHGDVRAAGIVVRIVQQRCRLFGLYPTRDSVQPMRNLVLSSEEAADWYRRHATEVGRPLARAEIPRPAGNTGKATADHDAATA